MLLIRATKVPNCQPKTQNKRRKTVKLRPNGGEQVDVWDLRDLWKLAN